MAVDLLVVGLGNPGDEYARTRHNSGAGTIALLATRHGGKLKRDRAKALADTVTIAGRRTLLAFPLTYYNLSGQSVGALVRRHDLGADEVVVVHDELDLPPGRIKVKLGGGLAGNKGLQSIKSHLGTADFVRVRIGVGKPPGRMDGADHVLRRPGKAERTELDIAIEEAADAVELIAADGVEAAMTKFNAREPLE
ncbi:MAG: aminoacyl-tRNA hydrolase [Acidimicrobiales bacterium]